MHKGQTYRSGQYHLHELDKMAYLLVAESEVPEVHDFVQGFSGDPFIEKVAKKLNMAKDVKNLYQKANKGSGASDNLGFLRSNPGAAGALIGAGLGAATSKDDRLGGAVMGAGLGGMGGAFAGPKLLAQKSSASGGLNKRKFNKRVEDLVEKRLSKQEGKLKDKLKDKLKKKEKEIEKSQLKAQGGKSNKNTNKSQNIPQNPIQQQVQQAKQQAQLNNPINQQSNKKQKKQQPQAPIQQANVGHSFDPFAPPSIDPNLLNRYSQTRTPVANTKTAPQTNSQPVQQNPMMQQAKQQVPQQQAQQVPQQQAQQVPQQQAKQVPQQQAQQVPQQQAQQVPQQQQPLLAQLVNGTNS
jgi:hypothetical protein